MTDRVLSEWMMIPIRRNIDIIEPLLFLVAALTLFFLGWMLGRESADAGPPVIPRHAVSYNRFGRAPHILVEPVGSIYSDRLHAAQLHILLQGAKTASRSE